MSIRVFVSYAHESAAHREAVRAFADCLRAHGYDAWIDQYAVDPDEGWPRWMQGQLDRAHFVFLVPTAALWRRWKGEEDPDRGHGATWEGLILTNRLYQAHGRAKGLRCVLVGEADARFVPEPLQGHSRFRPPGDCDALDRYLRGLPIGAEAPPLGALPPLPPQWSEPSKKHWDRRRPLMAFLLDAFRNEDLDRILGWLPGDTGTKLRHALPATHVPPNVYVTKVVDEIIAQRLVFQQDLWTLWRDERPVRASEIDALEATWR